ncbi:patatin-like phospholipase family protein [Desulfospira joergensenii]|uniref:patatin-like phospholipase family protein n=1 Tax=Desulfospira joergensenii TaxID=53329 RepID=UPI0003B5D317|nr:patatin-like phospholipase family protein [Desulfospira joergensenii]
MSENLIVLAGKSAYRHIREKGLDPSDIDLVLGASGAAKWLAIYGLDSVLFSHWFRNRKTPLHLFGTSIGAWKFAAAARSEPEMGFASLKDAYIHQYYNGDVTPAKVSRESRRIMDLFLTEKTVDQALSHPFLRMGFSAVRCKHLMASESNLLQALGMLSAFDLNLLSRKLQRFCYERTLFHDPRYNPQVMELNDYPTQRVALDKNNFSKALLASGSIPMVMKGVKDIPDAPRGVYRDGGLLDYHPAVPLGPDQKGFILYPHFYPEITPGWFDKKFPRRRVKGGLADRFILLAPSPEFVATLPFARIPDRRDFVRLKGQDEVRVKAWTRAADMSYALGDEFMESVQTGSIRDRVRMIA